MSKIDPLLSEEERKYPDWWPTRVTETEERLDMSRKHYEMLAGLIRKWEINYVGFPAELADILEEDNPRFDRERFLAACLPRDTEADEIRSQEEEANFPG